jgi:hypothetical protein
VKRVLVVAALLLALTLVGACVSAVEDGEAIGQKDKVAFAAETKLAFQARMVVGSRFQVTTRALDEDDDELKAALAGATLASGNTDVFTVDADGNVEMVGPGDADLVVQGADGELDRITLKAGKPGATTLVDAGLLSGTDAVDARLPGAFAIRAETDTQLFISAVDECGGDLLDLHASTLEAAPGAVPVSIESPAPASFVIKTQVPGAADVILKTPGLDDLPFSVTAVDTSQIDEVQVAVAAVDGPQGTLFGRVFADDVEVAGPLELSWTSEPRVTLGATTGRAVSATVSFPADGEPPDDRSAKVTAEIFGEAGTVDLLDPNLTKTTSLGTPARVLENPKSPDASCQGGEAVCDPAAAGLVLLGVGRLRRLRSLPSCRRHG